MPPLRIGKVARLANVNVQTLRFYERKGLLPKPARRLSGYREYPNEAIGIVRLIKHVQGLGFSLKEIKQLLSLRKLPSATLSATCVMLESKIDEIDAQIAELAAIRSTLVQMLDNHHERGGASFAQAFDRHVQQLINEAMARESPARLEQPRQAAPRRKRLPRTEKTA